MKHRKLTKRSRFTPEEKWLNVDNLVNIILVLFLIGIVVFIAIESGKNENQKGAQDRINKFEDVMLDRTSPGMVALREGSIRTYQETVKETGGETTKPAEQAGGPGNTLAPVVAPTRGPTVTYSKTSFKWDQIHTNANWIWVGCKMTGSYRHLRELGYFPIIQTVPTSNKEIYGDFSIFCEGGKIGIRVGGNSVVTAQKFDFDHKLTYMIEIKITFISATKSRVDLIIDGSNVGHSFTIYDEHLVHKLKALPVTMELLPNVGAAWLQQNKTPLHNNWGSIVEKVVNH